MIKNDKQLAVTKKRLGEFRKALVQLELSEGDPLLKVLETNAIKSKIEDFENDIIEFASLKSGQMNSIYINSISNISEALIKSRIIKGWTQAELASKIRLKEQQIQRYESEDYESASIARLSEIASALDWKIPRFRIEIKEPKFLFPLTCDSNLYKEASSKLREKKALIEI